jgi:myotubularin-related protein 9
LNSLEAETLTLFRFEGLVAREWLAAGHPFRERCIKLGTSNMRYKGQAPTFLMFLDAVYQVCAVDILD